MVTVKKSGEGSYEVAFQKPVEIIDQQTGYLLKKEVGKILTANRIVQINLNKVNEADKNGFKMLQQLIELAAKRHCTLEFTNTKPAIQKNLQFLK